MIRRRSREASTNRSGRRWRWRVARILAAVAVCAGTLGMASPAMAFNLPGFGSCKTAPVPQSPGGGLAGWIEIRPARPPAPASAFGAHAASTEYVQYGYAGLHWTVYDLGCFPVLSVPTMLMTLGGDLQMSSATAIVAADNAVHTWAADPSWMSDLTPVVNSTAGTLFRVLFVTWAGAALMIVAISVTMRAHRSDVPSALNLAGWAVLVITLVSGVVAAPGWAGRQAASLMGTTLSALDAGFVGPGGQASAAQAHSSLTVSTVLYPAWLRGEFGDPSSAAAQQYGPQLFQAQALSWSQAARPPQQVAATVKANEATWEHVAAEVQSADPQAYAAIQGNTGGALSAGFLALVTAVIVCGFDLIASLVVVVALLGVLAGVVMLPALGVVGMHHRMRHLIMTPASRILGMLINGLLWAVAAGIDQLATKALLTQVVLPLQLALLILALLPIVFWMLIRKVQGKPAIPRTAKRAALLGLGYATMRRGTRRGVEDALARQPAGAPAGDMWWDGDPWTWTAGPYTPPRGGLPPAPPPVPPLGGGGGGGAGPFAPSLPRGGSALPPPPAPPATPPGPGPRPGGNGSGPAPGGPQPRPVMPGGGAGTAVLPPPPVPGPASGPSEHTGGGVAPGTADDVVTPAMDQIFRPGEALPGPAGPVDGGRLYDGGPAGNGGAPPSGAQAAPGGPGRRPGRITRRPAGTWRRVMAESPSPREPASGKAQVWIENDADGVYVLVRKANGTARTAVADDEQAEIAGRRARQWDWQREAWW